MNTVSCQCRLRSLLAALVLPLLLRRTDKVSRQPGARLRRKVRGVIEATKLATGTEDEIVLEIHGERGAIRFRLMQPHYLEFFDAGTTDRPLGGDAGWKSIPCGGRYESPNNDFPSPKATIGWMRAHVACLSNFLHTVLYGFVNSVGEEKQCINTRNVQ